MDALGEGVLPATAIKVLCVDDNPDLALLLDKQISTQGDMRSVGQVHDLDHVLEEVCRRQPHVVVLDLRMLGRDSFGTLRDLSRSYPAARVLIYSGFDQDEPILQAREAGAWGYVPKQKGVDDLLGAIRRVAGGERSFPLG